MTTHEASRVDTATLDGLIEGPVPPVPDGEQRLQQWVEFASSHHLPFQLSVEGASFNLLADHRPIPLGDKDDLRERLQQAIEQLQRVFPEDLQGRVFSTVRSTEFRRGKKIESLYVVTRRGVDVRSREVSWSEEPSSSPRLRNLPWFPISAGGALLLVALIISFFVVDYRQLIRSWLSPYTTVDPESYEIDAAALSRYIQASKVDAASKDFIAIEVQRTDAYPLSWSVFRQEEERLREDKDLGGYLVFHRLVVQGRLDVSYVAEDGTVLGREERDASALREKESLTFQLPVKQYPDAVRIVLSN